MIKRLTLSLVLVLLLSLPIIAQDNLSFETAPCPVNMPFGFVEDTGAGGIECGFVAVPEFHAAPDGNSIRVAVAVIHSTNPSPEADPVFMEQGGPGGSTLTSFIRLAPLFAPILAERDIILVEQRGTQYSEPALTCPEIFELTLEYIDVDTTVDEGFAVQGAAYQACFDRLASEGVNLSAFNSVENAADMIDVADALGYDEINFYGVSYGTMLGQHLLRDFEDRIRSIVFDSVVPLELNFIPDSIASANEALHVIFDTCSADELCNTLYPNLEDTLYTTYTELNANPVYVPVYDPETGIAYDAFFNGDILLQFLRSIQYTTEFLPSIPAFIDAAANGDFEWVERLYGVFAIDAGRDIADAMFVSVICAEDSDFSEADVTTDNIREEYVNSRLLAITSIQGACEIAQVDILDDYVDDPVISDVPALLTSGQFDPVTPPRYADILAANLSNSTNLVFPGVGHGALLGGECPLSIIANFIDDPEDEVNSDCIDDMGISYHEFTTDPTGRLQFPLPVDLVDVSTDSYASYADEENDIRLSIIGIENLDINAAIDEALSSVIRADFDTPALIEAVEESGFGEAVNKIYQDGTNLILVYAFVVEDITSVIILEFPPTQLARINPIILPVVANMFSID